MQASGLGSSDEVRAAWHQARAEAVNILKEKGFTEAGKALLNAGLGVDGSGVGVGAGDGPQNLQEQDSGQNDQQQMNVHGADPQQPLSQGASDGAMKLGSHGQGPVILKEQLFAQNTQTMLHGDGVHVAPNNIVSSFASSDREPKRFAEAYKKLKNWITDANLDYVKREAKQLLYPVFLHLFLELMLRKSEPDKREARAFIKQFANEHKAEHRAEVQAFEKLLSADALKKDLTAQMFLSNRYIIHLSATSHELLMKFLRREQLFPILHVLNNHIHLKVVADRPGIHDLGQNGLFVDGVAKCKRKNEEDSGDLNSRPLKLLWGSLKDRVKTEEEQLANTASGEAKDKGLNVDINKEASDSIPLPKIDYTVMIKELEDARNKVKVSIDTLPSVAMFTAQHGAASLNCMDFTSDGSTIACGFSDSTIRVFDTENQYSSRTLRGHAGPVYGTSFSPNSRLLASCSTDASICLWGCDASLGNGPLVNLRGHSSACWDVAFAPMGHYIASASRDRTARVWSTDKAQPLRIMAGHISDVDIVKWHPNCNYIATGSSDRTIRLWDVQTGETVRLLTGHSGSVTALEFSPDGYTIASGGDSGSVLIWDLRNGRRVATLKQHTLPVWSLAFEQDHGELLASSAADCSVRLWNCSALTSAVKTENPSNGNGVGGDGRDAAANGKGVENAQAQGGVIPPSSNNNGQGSETEIGTGRQPRLLKVLYTKSTPVIDLKFTRRNLLLAGGAIDCL